MRAVYIYYYGGFGFKHEFSVDFYNCKSGKDMKYINARNYWVERLRNLMVNTGGNYYVEKKS